MDCAKSFVLVRRQFELTVKTPALILSGNTPLVAFGPLIRGDLVQLTNEDLITSDAKMSPGIVADLARVNQVELFRVRVEQQ